MSAGAVKSAPTPRVTSLCVHNRRKNECRACKGSSICEHNKRRNECKDCNGASICEHRRRRRECKECGGSSICEHRMLKRRCKICKGASICEHNRRKNECKDCAGTSICEHNRLRRHCKQCGGTSICEHKRRRNVCRDCKGTAICLHERRKSQCSECSKLDSPEPESTQGSPVLGQNSTIPRPVVFPSPSMDTLGFTNAATNPFSVHNSFLNAANVNWLTQPLVNLAAQAQPSMNFGQMAPAPGGISSGFAAPPADDKGKLPSPANTAAMIALLRHQLQSLPHAPPSLPQPALTFNLNSAMSSFPLSSPAVAPSRQGSTALLNANLQPLALPAANPVQNLRLPYMRNPLPHHDPTFQSAPVSSLFQVGGGSSQALASNVSMSNINPMPERGNRDSERPHSGQSASSMQLPPSFFFMPGNQR